MSLTVTIPGLPLVGRRAAASARLGRLLIRRTRRTGAALLAVVERGAERRTRVLVDTSPDLREQLLDAKATDRRIVLHPRAGGPYHGIDDLRSPSSIAAAADRRLCDEATARVLLDRFGYCFASPPAAATRRPHRAPHCGGRRCHG